MVILAKLAEKVNEEKMVAAKRAAEDAAQQEHIAREALKKVADLREHVSTIDAALRDARVFLRKFDGCQRKEMTLEDLFQMSSELDAVSLPMPQMAGIAKELRASGTTKDTTEENIAKAMHSFGKGILAAHNWQNNSGQFRILT